MKNRQRPWGAFVASLLATGAVLALLHAGLPFLATPVPPLGKLLSPSEGFYRNMDDAYWAGNFQLKELRAPVDVYYDQRLVPHVYAASPSDLFFVQGFLQAQHRLFQLEMVSRSAEGTLSELVGARTLEFDRIRRRYGPQKIIGEITEVWAQDPELALVVNNFVKGVNAYIRQLEPRDYPIEYKLFGATPSLWSPERSAYIALSMAYDLNHANHDIEATNTRAIIGPEAFEELFPERSRNFDPVIPRGTPFSSSDSALIRAANLLQDQLQGVHSLLLRENNYQAPEAGIGSNNWAVSSRRTENGVTYLANDPHLGLSLPSIWFETELHSGDYQVHGVSLPGVPGLTIGFNETAAWGVTNVGHDMLDWYKIEYLNADKTRYRGRDGKTHELTYRVERIGVLGGEDVLDTVAVTEFGPLVFTDTSDYRYGLAVDWLSLRENNGAILRAILGLDRAHSVDDFLEASRHFRWPAQNILFANNRGDIAMRVSGALPRRLPQEGRFVMTASSRRAGGILADELNPVVVNPPQGYLTSANQPSTDESYPYYYQSENFNEYRARRANMLLRGDTAAPSPLNLEDMKAFQLDNFSLKAAEMLPLLIGYIERGKLNDTQLEHLQQLEQWDYEYGKFGQAPILFDEWAAEVSRQTWDEITGKKAGTARLKPAEWRLVDLLEQEPRSRWFDDVATTPRESAGDIVQRSFMLISDRVDSLRREGVNNYEDYLHTNIRHLARLPAFSRTFVSTAGGRDALNSQRGTVGPSWRMIVALSDETRALVVYPGGQSGHVGDPHYDDMVDAWASGSYYPVQLRNRPQQLPADGFQKVTFTP